MSDREDRVRQAIVKHGGKVRDLPANVRDDAVAICIAFANTELSRAAQIAENIAEAQADGWKRNPGLDNSGEVAASNTGFYIATAIRNLKDEK